MALGMCIEEISLALIVFAISATEIAQWQLGQGDFLTVFINNRTTVTLTVKSLSCPTIVPRVDG